jgi:hypothetical protein
MGGLVNMPKRGQRNRQAKQTDQYRKMYANAPQLCKSQVYNELYAKLRQDRRLDRFLAVLQHCSIKGLSLNDAIDVLISAFPSYIDKKELTIEVLTDMIKSYSDVSMAWGYGNIGDEISQLIVKNKALRIIEDTDKMEDIKIYMELFGSNREVEKNDTVINFVMSKHID